MTKNSSNKNRTVVRDSISGRFVPKRQAITRPRTTETEKIKIKK